MGSPWLEESSGLMRFLISLRHNERQLTMPSHVAIAYKFAKRLKPKNTLYNHGVPILTSRALCGPLVDRL